MKKFEPRITSGTRYTGFKLGDKNILFSKSAIDLVCSFNPVSILFSESDGIIRIKKGGRINIPRHGMFKADCSSLTMPRGRYYLKDVQDEWIDFTNK